MRSSPSNNIHFLDLLDLVLGLFGGELGTKKAARVGSPMVFPPHRRIRSIIANSIVFFMRSNDILACKFLLGGYSTVKYVDNREDGGNTRSHFLDLEAYSAQRAE